MTREQKVRKAQQLRAKGLKLREIAQVMRAPLSTVDSWINDPDLRKHLDRRRRNGGVCVDCGKGTDGSNGPALRCASCHLERYNAHRRELKAKVDARVAGLAKKGLTNYEIAERLGVSRQAVANRRCRFRRVDPTVPEAPRGSRAHRERRAA